VNSQWISSHACEKENEQGSTKAKEMRQIKIKITMMRSILFSFERTVEISLVGFPKNYFKAAT
jgi:hypothetical protein